MGEVRIDLARPMKIHIVGIGGAGMSSIALALAGMGHTVTGSDLRSSAGLTRLENAGIGVQVGHRADNVPGEVDVVTASTAVPPDNPELAAAAERAVPVLRRSEMLAAICAVRRTIAIAGTHGKTTTSSMLALVLRHAGMHPSFVVGGELNEIGAGAAWDRGEWFVVEADESDGTFVELQAEAVVVTNVEPDHLNHYGGFDALVATFDRFLAQAPGPRVVCADDPVAMRLGEAHQAITYGTSEDADYRLTVVDAGRRGTRFAVSREGRSVAQVSLPVPGVHNATNACGALVAATLLGVEPEVAAEGLARYAGVARRFQFRGEAGGITFVDDYAHLPTEVRAALSTAAGGGWRRVVCVFQPHRYSRTGSLWQDFADAFVDADRLVVTDVYSAGETPRPGVTGRLIVHAVLDSHPDAAVAYLPHRADQIGYLRKILRPGDLCLTLGAGDLTLLPDQLVAAIEEAGG